MRLCSVEGCGRPHQGRGWCRLHYERWYRTGSIDAVAQGHPGNFTPLTEIGVTYRQLDYWCRTGYVTLSAPANGSGTRRLVTSDEVEAIKALAGEVADIEKRWAAIRSGEFFATQILTPQTETK